MPSRVVTMIGDGFVPLFPLEQTATYLAIYASVTKTTGLDYSNLRYPVRKGFFGYYQLFDDQAVSASGPLEFQSQLLWKNVDCCQLIFTRICELGAYIQSINTSLRPGFSATFQGVNVSLSPSFPDGFPAYPELLFSPNPSSVAFRLEPNAVGELTIISEYQLDNQCNPDTAVGDAPGGCGGIGTPPTEMPAGCLPVPPSGGPS